MGPRTPQEARKEARRPQKGQKEAQEAPGGPNRGNSVLPCNTFNSTRRVGENFPLTESPVRRPL